MAAKVENISIKSKTATYYDGSRLIASILQMDLPTTFDLTGYKLQTRRDKQGKSVGMEVPLLLEFASDKIWAVDIYDKSDYPNYQEIPHDHILRLPIANGLTGGLISSLHGNGNGISIRYYGDDPTWTDGLLIPIN